MLAVLADGLSEVPQAGHCLPAAQHMATSSPLARKTSRQCERKGILAATRPRSCPERNIKTPIHFGVSHRSALSDTEWRQRVAVTTSPTSFSRSTAVAAGDNGNIAPAPDPGDRGQS